MNRTCRAAPAKLNLTLDILGRRADGYHDLTMVMQSVALADTVTLEEQETGFTLDTGGAFVPDGVQSLEERAADAFFAHIGRPRPGLRVTLEKRTPAYAGVGGGSSDVAALLRLLREAYCPELSARELTEIGLSIGSDVPFCLLGGTARAEGRGERLTPLPPLPPCSVVLCKPDFGLPTGPLFARADRVAFQRRPDTDGLLRALAEGSLCGVAERLCNVFEEALPEERAEEVFTIKHRLLDFGARGASMSGSGPTVFALFEDAAAASHAAERLRETYRETFLTVPLAAEPL